MFAARWRKLGINGTVNGMDEFEPQMLETARGRFAVRETGAGPPLVMVHGWPESSYCWHGVAEQLRDQFRIIAPDLRGLGDSVRTLEPEPYTKQALGADLLALLDALEFERCILIGHDWGGAAVQEAALAAPERVERMVLLNIPVLPNARGNAAAQTKLAGNPAPLWYQFFQNARDADGTGLAEAMIPGNERVWLGHFLRTWAAEGIAEDAFDEYVRCYAQPDTPTTGANFYRVYKTDMKRWMELSGTRFSAPALYIHGHHDPVIIPEFTHHLEDVFDNIRVESLEAAHFVQEEKPTEVAELIREFAT